MGASERTGEPSSVAKAAYHSADRGGARAHAGAAAPANPPHGGLDREPRDEGRLRTAV